MSGAVLSATEMDRTDAELVVAAAAGDHDAFAALYDRYGSRIYDLCAHMLRDRDEAADATAEVFLSASEHLGQLRDPSKCKSWLYAIARNEVYRRTRRRSRETVVDMSGDDFAPAVTPADDDALGDPAATGALLREAALGLDDRDRFVLELTLAGKLDGRELGDALGVSEDTAYQAAHRMRERLARSVGALLVARQGKADCDQLTALLATWDGTYSVLWRKRVARHVDGCETCERRRKAVPAAIFSGSAFAATPIAFLTPPHWLREHVVTGAHFEPASTRGWDRNGFPHAPGRRRRVAMIAVLGAALLLLTVVIANVAGGTPNNRRVVKVSSPATTMAGTRAATTTLPPATTTTSATTSPTSRGRGIIATRPTTPGATTRTTPTTRQRSATTVTTAAPDLTGPTIDLSDVPTDLTEGTCPAGSNPPLVVHAADPSGVQSVSMVFSGPHTGTVTLSHASGTTWHATWNPPPDGVEQSYTVTFRARDERGNTSGAGMTINSHICIL